MSPRRIQYQRYGGPERMELVEFQAPRPGPGEVLVRVKAAAANGLDWKIRNGSMRIMTGRRLPRGLGHDFSGVIEAVGDGVTGLKPGDDVLGAASLKASGAFADYVVTSAENLARKPEELSFEQAAAIPIVGVTALQAVTGGGRLRPGDSIFVNGCLGNVGRIAVQLGIAEGFSVAGSSRAGSRADAEALGVSPVVDFDFDPESLRGRFDLVFDTAGTLKPRTARTLLRPGGRIVDINGTLAKMLRGVLPGPHSMQFTTFAAADLATIAQAVTDGKIEVPIARVVPLAEAIPALAELEQHGRPKGGKLVIAMR